MAFFACSGQLGNTSDDFPPAKNGETSDVGPESGALPPGSGDGTAAGQDVVVATVAVPPEFQGVPVLFGVSFFRSSPPTGMPDAFGDRIDRPAVVAGQDFPFSTTQAGLVGQYYITTVVYCEGGGNGRDPVAGIDWVAMAMQPLTLGPGTGKVDAGRIELIPQK
jgi:hypothetical protein